MNHSCPQVSFSYNTNGVCCGPNPFADVCFRNSAVPQVDDFVSIFEISYQRTFAGHSAHNLPNFITDISLYLGGSFRKLSVAANGLLNCAIRQNLNYQPFFVSQCDTCAFIFYIPAFISDNFSSTTSCFLCFDWHNFLFWGLRVSIQAGSVSCSQYTSVRSCSFCTWLIVSVGGLILNYNSAFRLLSMRWLSGVLAHRGYGFGLCWDGVQHFSKHLNAILKFQPKFSSAVRIFFRFKVQNLVFHWSLTRNTGG